MAITTRIAPMYGGQKIFAALLFAVFGVWGVIDYGWTIPARERVSAQYEHVQAQRNELLERQKQQRFLTPAELQTLQDLDTQLAQLAPGGKVPPKPGKFDRAIQWAYISCLPFAPWFMLMFIRAKRQKYTLDDDGVLHFTGDAEHKSGVWTCDDIVDIDMERWMAKSIAYAIHRDGRRLKLDAYLHKDLHLIVGAIAHRLHPDQWEPDARMVKSDAQGSSPDSPPAPADEYEQPAAT